MEAVIFAITGLISILCAIAMILSPNAVHSALWLVLNFSAVAVLYLMLQAPFLAMIQITVYAGAIMVLFLFVIMLLGAEKGQEERDAISWQRPLAIVLGLLLLGEAGFVFFSTGTTAVPRATTTEIGSPLAIAQALFTTYLLPFEITSVLLLVALLGAVVLTIKSRAGESSREKETIRVDGSQGVGRGLEIESPRAEVRR
jgi:NADH-quinone oxidoreductase subunit J